MSSSCLSAQPELSCLTSAAPLQREQSTDAVLWMTMMHSGGRTSCFRSITLAGDIQIVPALIGRNERADIQNMTNSSAAQPEIFLHLGYTWLHSVGCGLCRLPPLTWRIHLSFHHIALLNNNTITLPCVVHRDGCGQVASPVRFH